MIRAVEANHDIWALPVTSRYLATSKILAQDVARFPLIVVQHILLDTAHFIKTLLEIGFNLQAVIGIDYSVNRGAVEFVQGLGIEPRILPYRQIGNAIREILAASEQKCVVQDVGGYAAEVMAQFPSLLADRCIGIIEETKQGVWQYEAIDVPCVPIVEIASTELKQVEAMYVGEAVVRSLEEDLLSIGRTLAGVHTSVLGFGNIGASCAAALRRRNSLVAAYDTNPLRRVEATAQGFFVAPRDRVLSYGDVIVGASGTRSILDADLTKLRQGVVLASASSKQVEFPIDDLKRGSAEASISRRLRRYQTEGFREVVIVNDGYPVNFESFSLPSFVSDLLFTQISAALESLWCGGCALTVAPLCQEAQERAADMWLDHYRAD